MPTLFDLWVDHIFHQTPPSPQLDYTSTEWFMFTILKQAFQNGIIKQKIHVKTYWISIPVLLIAVKWDAIGNCSSPELQVAICRIFLLSIANCSSFICFPIFSEEFSEEAGWSAVSSLSFATSYPLPVASCRILLLLLLPIATDLATFTSVRATWKPANINM